MEEDIKILKDYIQEELKIFNRDELEDTDGFHISYKEIRAIENLIARYKELEAENLSLTNSYFQVSREFEAKPKNFDYIPKSKIKEKIEKLKKYGNNLTEEQRQKETEFLQGKLKAYEELLED